MVMTLIDSTCREGVAPKRVQSPIGVHLRRARRRDAPAVARLTGEGPLSITQLTGGLPITRRAVTKHLRVMEDAGLVRSSARGRERVWELEERRLQLARRHWKRSR
jgi:DNA-binding transcriptional ArsR family regulator